MSAHPDTPAPAVRPSLDELRRLFQPRSIVLVGAKEGNHRLAAFETKMGQLGFDGRLHFVGRSGGTTGTGGLIVPTCAEIGEPVDFAVVIAPAAAALDILDDLAAASIRGAYFLASGWAETGPDGRAAQDALVEKARRLGVLVVGPNSLGFVSYANHTGGFASSFPPDVIPGAVGIASQSGGMGDALAELARELGIGISHLITTGNEAMVSTTDALHFLVEDEATRVVAMFTEAVKDPDLFLACARRARELGKAIVVVKAGSSELAARNALSHTGSLVGDDRVIDTAFRQHGVIRVHGLEELLITATLIAHTGALSAPGVAVVSISGGSCDMVADEAERVGLELPELSERATAQIRELLPDYASVQNPLDMTGGAAGGDAFEKVLNIVDGEDAFGVIAVLCNVPVFESGMSAIGKSMLATIGRGLAQSGKPGVQLSQTFGHLGTFGRAAVKEAGIELCLPGLALGTQALGHVSVWSRWLERHPVAPTPSTIASVELGDARGSLSEWEARSILESAGVPFVPAELAQSADEAVKAAVSIGGPVAMKLVSPDVLHKSDVGAVRLAVEGDAAVREAYEAVVAAGRAVGADVRVDGVLIAPMRRGGQELLVGVTVDADWGPVLVVGLGGIFVEVLRDTAMRLLPVSRSDVEEMLGELKGAALLRGARGTPPVAIAPLVDAVLAVANAALGLGPRLESLEINPLRAASDGSEALDALVVLAE